MRTTWVACTVLATRAPYVKTAPVANPWTAEAASSWQPWMTIPAGRQIVLPAQSSCKAVVQERRQLRALMSGSR